MLNNISLTIYFHINFLSFKNNGGYILGSIMGDIRRVYLGLSLHLICEFVPSLRGPPWGR